MNVISTRHETLSQLLPLVQQRYPAAQLKKLWLTPEIIHVIKAADPEFVLRVKPDAVKIDLFRWL